MYISLLSYANKGFKDHDCKDFMCQFLSEYTKDDLQIKAHPQALRKKLYIFRNLNSQQF